MESDCGVQSRLGWERPDPVADSKSKLSFGRFSLFSLGAAYDTNYRVDD